VLSPDRQTETMNVLPLPMVINCVSVGQCGAVRALKKVGNDSENELSGNWVGALSNYGYTEMIGQFTKCLNNQLSILNYSCNYFCNHVLNQAVMYRLKWFF
jgi:hypothetical protein